MTRTAAVLWLLSASAAPSPGQGLFAEAASTAPRAAPPRLGVVRSRPVRLRLGLIPGAAARDAARGVLPPRGHRLTLNLFDDVLVRARMAWTQRRGSALAWAGKIEGEPIGDVVLAAVDGVVSGSVVWPGGAYRIRFDGSTHVVEQLDHDQFPESGCFKEVPGVAAEVGGMPVANADDGSLVDVLVVYTPAARAAAGGTPAMLSQVNLAVAETNTGYANSNVVQRLRLAGTAEVGYTESGDVSEDLDRLTATGDGFLDGVHALRDGDRADVVSLITETPSSPCGVAWLMRGNDPGFGPHAFSVVELACMTGYYSFGHEIGHNMGLNHARADYADTPVGAFPYSFGYKHPSHLFRTVMAYNCPVGCPRVLHFSNPNVTYGGHPTGVSEASPSSAYNALSLDNTRVTVANWRRGPSLTLLAPIGGESWRAGSTRAITWTASGLPAGAVVHITYSNGSSRGFVTNRTAGAAIASVPAGQGSYEWEVPFDVGRWWRVSLCVPAPASPARGSTGGRPCLVSAASGAPFSIVP
ncbi:MAG TPA: M12 family metallo-peptidase [Vicinamibacteria bacterium]|nr:M12 family metallo-peptidase [Vicinamibacteria bacterium]